MDSELDMQDLTSGIRSWVSMLRIARRLRYLNPDKVGGSSGMGRRREALGIETGFAMAGGGMFGMMWVGGLA